MIEISNNILTYLTSLFGEDAAKKYIEFIKQAPTQYIRVNSLKTTKEELANKLLRDYEIKTEEIDGFPNSLKIISGNELVSKTIEHIIGEYYMQGLSSMIPPMVLNPSPNDIVLDLCSAPGSKTTELGEMMQSDGVLIANEIALDRVKMLVYNLDRMNLTNFGVIHNKGEYLSKVYNDYFDKVLVDAPCSGLGIIQKKEEVSNWWNIERATKLGDLQLRLLIAAIKMVKVGGEIVYSTCTLTPEENEFIIDKVLKKYPVEIQEIELPVKSIPAFTECYGEELNPDLVKARRILPWEVDSDGFFIVKLKKIDETTPPDPMPLKKSHLNLLNYEKKEINSLLKNIEAVFGIPSEILSKYKYIIKKNDIFFLNKAWNDDNLSLFDRIGIKFGVIDKRNQITLHTNSAQVLQKYITKSIYSIENFNELKTYLEGGIIKKSCELTGQCVIKYKDFILGTAIITEQGIKSRFPRAKRTQEILTY